MKVIRSVVFSEDAVELHYMTVPDDVRGEGQLIASHSLAIDAGLKSQYLDEIEDVRDACQRLLVDALEDFATTPAFEPIGPSNDEEDEEDEEE